MRKVIAICVVVAGFLALQCSRMPDNVSLKSSIDEGAAKVNNAMNVITSTEGYKLMSLNDLTKSEESYNDSITLGLVAGEYNFVPDTFYCRHYFRSFWKFEKTGESDQMIVNMPQYLVLHPRFLYQPAPADTVPVNDFTIAASDYHYYFTFLSKYDYLLDASFTLSGEDIGSLHVAAAGETFADRSYSSRYDFTDELSVTVSYSKGDTSVSSFALTDGDDVILSEEREYVWNDHRIKEHTYTLTIGDVKIVRSNTVDSIEVYVNDILQSTAGAVITDDESDGTLCHHRDILLTFDDGTTANLSDLISPALDALKELIDPMREMYFARRITDYIALSIYYRQAD